ncbi:hypothetical protein BDZ91DRAFT_769125 [Kalaharituber pfeilii]|nr:hypothetical protein BDZ91DRAFT_769125 [Kalaharituber pfeilii]
MYALWSSVPFEAVNDCEQLLVMVSSIRFYPHERSTGVIRNACLSSSNDCRSWPVGNSIKLVAINVCDQVVVVGPICWSYYFNGILPGFHPSLPKNSPRPFLVMKAIFDLSPDIASLFWRVWYEWEGYRFGTMILLSLLCMASSSHAIGYFSIRVIEWDLIIPGLVG